jgi:hypothetical protein
MTLVPRTEAARRIALFLGLLFVFSYFAQGGGFNQNATLGEIREWVEHGRFEIDAWTSITGDVSYYGNRVYSNKNPSVFFFVAPIYLIIFRLAVALGFDPSSASYQLVITHVLTVLCAGIWGALLSVVLVPLLRRLFPLLGETDPHRLSAIACLGTLILPYSTVAFVHVFETFWLVTTFYFLVRHFQDGDTESLVLLGLSLGVALLANQLFAAVATVVVAQILWRDRRPRSLLLLGVAVLLPLLPLLAYNKVNFDSFFSSNRHHLDPAWTDPSLFLGVFGWPDLSRLGQLFGKGGKSIFPSMIFLYAGFLAPIFADRGTTPSRYFAYPLASIVSSLLVVSSFNGWHGGSCYGPRYMTGALTLLAVFTAPAYSRFPRTYVLLGLWSIAVMFVVTSASLWVSEQDPAPLRNSIWPAFQRGAFRGRVFPSFPDPPALFYRYNLGHLFGLKGHWSLLPVALVLSWMLHAFVRRHPSPPDSGGGSSSRAKHT